MIANSFIISLQQKIYIFERHLEYMQNVNLKYTFILKKHFPYLFERLGTFFSI